jgi:hypothetical protein
MMEKELGENGMSKFHAKIDDEGRLELIEINKSNNKILERIVLVKDEIKELSDLLRFNDWIKS